jgi:predicted CoA-binding protein
MNDKFFSKIKIIAIVGLSDKPERPSYEVGLYLKSKGFQIIPVNPNITEWEGEKSYPRLSAIPKEIQIDVIDIFRKSDEVLPIVKESIERGGIKAIWMQEGVSNDEAETLARNNGLQVVSNMCMMKAHKSQL